MFGKSETVNDVPDAPSEEISLEGPIVLDLGQVRDEPVATGWHSVVIERADAGISREKKLPKIFFLSRVTDEASPEYNRTVIWNCMLEGDGLVFTKRCFAALGMPEHLNYPTYQALADDTLSREVDVQVKHRVYKGEKQASVNNWRPLTPGISF